MAGMPSSFGRYVKARREKLHLSYSDVATALGVSKAYIFDIEKGNNKPPLDYKKLEAWADVLELSNSVLRDELFDLAVVGRNIPPADVTKAILENNNIKQALRIAVRNNATDDFWKKIVESNPNTDKEVNSDEK